MSGSIIRVTMDVAFIASAYLFMIQTKTVIVN